MAFGIVTEPMLAWAGRPKPPKGAILLNQNENPLGPCEAARTAAQALVVTAGRYQTELSDSLVETFARMEGVKPDYVRPFAGSSVPLQAAVRAFTSPTRSYVAADPGYEAGMFTAEHVGARVVNVKLTETHAHDVKAMLAAAPDAGLFYVCVPNNPTGTVTPHSDIEYLVEKKPKDAVVAVDEAYIHFSDAISAIDQVKAEKDVIVLRTFSKIYGMAGLRCGFAVGRPDLLDRLEKFSGWNFMPVTAVVAAAASLKDPSLIPDRKRINATIRGKTFAWLDRNSYAYIPSEANCFLLDAKRPGKELIEAMIKENVAIGRVWPVMPNWVRITVGTEPEMEQFQAAFQKIMNGRTVAKYLSVPKPHSRREWRLS
jgi:histidinol-phosphate aminotransferase